MPKIKIVLTGGVLTPAMAVIAELQKSQKWEIYYLGRKTAAEGERLVSAEAKIIPKLGVEFIPIAAGRLQRRFSRYTLPSLLRIPVGFFQAILVLAKIRPQVICSFGGYVSVPVVLAGWLWRIPILTHEQTVVFGLASKINAFFAQKVAVSFPQSVAFFPKGKAVLTGNPIRKEIFEIKKPSWFSNLQLSSYPVIYITGGNQGSHTINMAVLEILPKLLEKYVVIHQTGKKDFDYISHLTSCVSQKYQNHYFVISYLGPEDIGWVLNKASLIISRAGANTVCEIAALGKPALFIPIPWSFKDEQTKNAQMLVDLGLAEILPQPELSGANLLKKISEMMENLNRYQKNTIQAKSLFHLDAAEKLVEEIEALVPL